MSDILQWLFVNTVLPLLPVPFFYLTAWIKRGASAIKWLPPIRDGQICFYSTTIAILSIKDIFGTNPTGTLWFFGLVGCWLISTYVYSVSVYTAIYPNGTLDDREAVGTRIAVASLACGLLTTLVVVSLRVSYGVLT